MYGLQLPDQNLNFDEQILEAAKCIAEATGALVKAASSAQRELIAQGRVGAYSGDYDEDSQWSQGLISAVSISVRHLLQGSKTLLVNYCSFLIILPSGVVGSDGSSGHPEPVRGS